MNIKLGIASILAVAVFLAASHSLEASAALYTQPYIQTLAIKTFKGQSTYVFNTCAGIRSLDGAGVVVSSDITAIRVKLDKTIKAGHCTINIVEIPTKDPSSVKAKLFLATHKKVMETYFVNKISVLKSKLQQLQQPQDNIGIKDTSMLSKADIHLINQIKAVKSEIKVAEAELKGRRTP